MARYGEGLAVGLLPDKDSEPGGSVGAIQNGLPCHTFVVHSSQPQAPKLLI